jgi:hypothetical protein
MCSVLEFLHAAHSWPRFHVLLTCLYVNSILNKGTKQKVLSSVENFPKCLTAFGKVYDDAISQVEGQLEEDCLPFRRALSWVIYAQRLLTKREVCIALAIEVSNTALNNDSGHLSNIFVLRCVP